MKYILVIYDIILWKGVVMDVILLAAGLGIRTALNYPKQFYPVNGKPCLAVTLEIFQMMDIFDNIIVTYNEDNKKDYEQLIKDYKITKAILVKGGETRQESVRFALKKVRTEKVLIHEAARPLISKDFINRILEYENEDVVVPTLPISYTVSEGGEYMEKILDRNRLHNIQLPQLFRTNILKDVHQKALNEHFSATEDSMLAFKYGYKVKFIKGSQSNIKITTPLDLLIVNHIVNGGLDD